MGGFVAQAETLNLQEALRCFWIISVIAFFVSVVFNMKVKSCPVFAVELSILATLCVYSAVNAYLNIAVVSDYELAMDFTSFPHSPLIFFFPLPVCILVSIVFYICREMKIIASSEMLPSARCWTKPRMAAWILSVVAGSLWLSINMAFERSFQLFTVLRFLVYTLCGFAAYLVVESILWIVRRFFAAADSQQAQKT